uniref:Uncharacterized protein n=1 Tax=Poecilia mexicana TaxID=48701 RepID=A0A3B3Y3J4_9TELE
FVLYSVLLFLPHFIDLLKFPGYRSSEYKVVCLWEISVKLRESRNPLTRMNQWCPCIHTSFLCRMQKHACTHTCNKCMVACIFDML